MGNLAPQRQFVQNQPVVIIGCEISKEHVPEELKKFGQGAYVIQSGLMYKSRPNAPDIGITRVKFPNGKDELFLTNDLYVPGSVTPGHTKSHTTNTPMNNTGSRIVNARR